MGDATKNQTSQNPSRTVFYVERLIEPRFTDASVVKDRGMPPSYLVDDGRDKPAVRIERFLSAATRGERCKFWNHLQPGRGIRYDSKEAEGDREDFWGEPITRTVVTVLSGNSADVLAVAFLFLGIGTTGGVMMLIVKYETTILVKQLHVFSTYAGNQPGMNIHAFEGEKGMTKKNRLL